MFYPLEVIDYAVDTSSNLAIFHFIVDLTNNKIKCRSIATGDTEGTFILPIQNKFFHVSIPYEVKKNPRSLIMQDKRDVFLELDILNIYEEE